MDRSLDRTVRLDDADASLPAGFAELVAECELHDEHAPFGEHTLLTLHGQRQVRHARISCTSGAGLDGYAVLSEGLGVWYVELAVAPVRRRAGVAGALLRAARAHVASHGGGLLRAWAHAGGDAVESLAREWRVSRSLLVLERGTGPVALPPVPDGLVLRTLEPTRSQDRDAWLALSNAAFAGHPENGAWTRADLDWRMEAGWTDGRRSPVLDGPDGLVAGVWTKAVVPDQAELYVVAVHPAQQGRGLGGLVVAEAMRLLASAGVARTVLYVDQANVAARALYARAGFTEHHRDRCFELAVAPEAGPRADRATAVSTA